ncbi:hypothetical protein Ddc_18699 [Ditylenchus destructor]|nr:hypothetical protein Ddc_18699 [Ditylenchus destructor]
MTHSRPVIPVSTVCDILALFGRRDLFRLSDVCYRFNAIVQRYFRTAPYLVFEELEYGRGDIKWKPSEEGSKSLMSKELFESLIDSKFSSVCRLLRNGRFVRKCRSLALICIRATNILPELLRNCHDHIIIRNTSWSDSRQIVPVTEVIDFLFSKPHSSTPFKDLSIVAFQPLDEENCTQIFDAMREKFLALTVPLLFQFSLSIGRTLHEGDKISFFNKHTKQYLNVVVSRSHISMQID